MITKIEENDGLMTVYLEGRLDTSASETTEAELRPVYETECKEITIDCTKLAYIASSGLRLFLAVLKNAKPKGSHVFITGISDSLRSVFAMTGFTNLFEFK